MEFKTKFFKEVNTIAYIPVVKRDKLYFVATVLFKFVK